MSRATFYETGTKMTRYLLEYERTGIPGKIHSTVIASARPVMQAISLFEDYYNTHVLSCVEAPGIAVQPDAIERIVQVGKYAV